MIAVDNLTVIFSRGTALETHALRGMNLTVGGGEFVSVIGSNGCGKSTLLNAVAGDVRPAAGKVFIDEKEVTAQPSHARAKRVARVFQDPLAGTCAHLTIEENLSLAQSRGDGRGLALAVCGKKRNLFRERVGILGLGLENRLGDKVGGLSGGQRQALSLIMATLAPSRILLLDEHTAALDPRMAEFVLRLTEKVYAQYQLTVLMVTHSLTAALRCGQRLLMLHQGKIAMDAAGEELSKMTANDLLQKFATATHEQTDELLSG